MTLLGWLAGGLFANLAVGLLAQEVHVPKVTGDLLDQVQQNPPQREATAGGHRVQRGSRCDDHVAQLGFALVIAQQLSHRHVGRYVQFTVRVGVGPGVSQVVLAGEDVADPVPLVVLEVTHETVQCQPGRCLHRPQHIVGGLSNLPGDEIALALQEAEQCGPLVPQMRGFGDASTGAVVPAAAVVQLTSPLPAQSATHPPATGQSPVAASVTELPSRWLAELAVPSRGDMSTTVTGLQLGLLGAAGAGLAHRMMREFETKGSFSTPTAVLLGFAYTGHGAWGGLGLLRRSDRIPLPAPAAWAVGLSLAGTGAGLALAGFSRFQSLGQLWGVERGVLVTGGPYRVTRNPQYTGYVMLWAGAGLARRSWRGLAAALTYAAAVRAWVPIEERHLSREFGDEYRHWAQRRSRWLGLPEANGPRSST